MNDRELQNLANEVSAAQAQLDAAQTVNADGTVTQADPAVQAQLQAAKAAAEPVTNRKNRPRPSITVKKKPSRAVLGLHRNRIPHGTTESYNDTTS